MEPLSGRPPRALALRLNKPHPWSCFGVRFKWSHSSGLWELSFPTPAAGGTSEGCGGATRSQLCPQKPGRGSAEMPTRAKGVCVITSSEGSPGHPGALVIPAGHHPSSRRALAFSLPPTALRLTVTCGSSVTPSCVPAPAGVHGCPASPPEVPAWTSSPCQASG